MSFEKISKIGLRSIRTVILDQLKLFTDEISSVLHDKLGVSVKNFYD